MSLEILGDEQDTDRANDFRQLPTPTGLNECPGCGSTPELWERHCGDYYHKVVACPNNGKKDPDFQCPFYYPPECFYKATKREAIAYWQKHTGSHER